MKDTSVGAKIKDTKTFYMRRESKEIYLYNIRTRDKERRKHKTREASLRCVAKYFYNITQISLITIDHLHPQHFLRSYLSLAVTRDVARDLLRERIWI